MKIRLTIMALLMLSASMANAATVKLQWDANDPAKQVTKYNVYQDEVKVVTVNSPLTTATIPNVNGDAHSFYVTAANDSGESAQSNTVTMPAIPKAIKNLKISITFDVTVP